MKVFAVGASRNIGYYSSLGLLKQGHDVVFVLRKPNTFDNDTAIKPFIDSKQAKLIQGDAQIANDMQKAWAEASADGPVDLVLFSVGGAPAFQLSRGFIVEPPDLCTSCLINTLSVLPRTQPQPRVVVITANGMTQASHHDLPFLLKGMYNYLLREPHNDKLGMERVCHYSAGWDWAAEDQVKDFVLSEGWESKVKGPEGWLKAIVVLRPAVLTDGAETGKYRVGEATPGLYYISRRDVGHFIANELVPNWEKYGNKALNIGY